MKETLELAIRRTGVKGERIQWRPRLLSDNGPCYLSKSSKEYLEEHDMGHTRGRIERYHRSMKNIFLLDNYYLSM